MGDVRNVDANQEADEARNRELGQIIRKSRQAERRTISECARMLGTTRWRYRQLEAGVSPMTAVELEKLAVLLNISYARILRSTSPDSAMVDSEDALGLAQGNTSGEHMTVHARAGEVWKLVIEVYVEP